MNSIATVFIDKYSLLISTTKISIWFVTHLGRLLNLQESQQYDYLARSFLQGRSDMPDPLSVQDISIYNHKYYAPFPILAALLIIPF